MMIVVCDRTGPSGSVLFFGSELSNKICLTRFGRMPARYSIWIYPRALDGISRLLTDCWQGARRKDAGKRQKEYLPDRVWQDIR